MRKSLLPLAAIAAMGLPAVPIAAQPPLQAAGTTADRTDGETLLAAAQAKLAWALIEKLAARGGATDTTISPASLASAFGIIALGAGAPMKAAIAKALGFGPERVEDNLAALSGVRGKLANAGNAFQSANRIVFAPSNPLDKIVSADLDSLGIDYSVADLAKPEVAADIDAWVKDITRGAIPEILGGPIEKASFVALNALHFKDRWKTPFDPQLTAMAPFKGADGKSGNVAMMRLGLAKRSFRQERNFVAVDLPFADERFSLMVVTTTDKPAPAKEFGKIAGWLSGAGFTSRSGDLALPRFSLAGREELMPALDALGLDKARHAATALQGLAPGAMLSQVVQRAMIDVDEEGAEAAAATAIMGSRSAGKR
jgi:serine protease inhibitor